MIFNWKTLRKGISLVLIIVMGTVSFTACSKKTAETAKKDVNNQKESKKINESGMPIVNGPITLKIMASQSPTQPPFNETMVIQEYEKMTNMRVEWDMVPYASIKEKKNITLASGDYPDVFFRMKVTPVDIVTYGSEQGVFLKLNDLIDKYAPNIKQMFEEYPEIKKGLTAPDGGIYCLPRVIDAEFASMRTGVRFWIREDWLKKLGLKEPTTTQELYDVLKAFKEKDPNGNNEADEIPLTGLNIGGVIADLSGAYGLNNRGKGQLFIDQNENGELRFIPADEQYRDMILYLNKLYTEGLLDQEIFTKKWKTVVAHASNFGCYSGFSPVLLNQEGYVGLGVIKGPKGDELFSAVMPILETLGMAVITSNNKYPEATMRWLDYMYSEEGAKLFNMGIDGETYSVTSDGKYEFTDVITNNPDGLSLDQARNLYMPSVSGWAGITMEKYFRGSEASMLALEAAEKTKPYHVKEVWPNFTYTTEENSKLSGLSADILNYVKEIRAKVIIGQYKFDDKGWNQYIETLNKMGLKEYMKINTQAYERYANIK